LRSFPDGKRNCYNLKPKQGKNHKYSIRAYFQYGNYDNKNKIPTFDQHLGVNLWGQVQLYSATSVLRTEAIHFSSTDTIEYCLVNTNQGVPFVSLLELWPLGDSNVYQPSSTLLTLDLQGRINLGESRFHFIRWLNFKPIFPCFDVHACCSKITRITKMCGLRNVTWLYSAKLTIYLRGSIMGARGQPGLTIPVRHNFLQVCVFPIFQS